MIDRLLKIISPHNCLVCGQTGKPVCAPCSYELASELPETCYRCNKLSQGSKTCRSCRSSSEVYVLHFAGEYRGIVRELIKQAKYGSVREAADSMASFMDEHLPIIGADVVTAVPTATRRVRQRGYDHSAHLAREFAKLRGLAFEKLLIRTSQTRQVGADIVTRRKQLEGVIQMRLPRSLEDMTVFLVDDVVSTGASLEACAQVLKQAGAKRVVAGVVARNF